MACIGLNLPLLHLQHKTVSVPPSSWLRSIRFIHHYLCGSIQSIKVWTHTHKLPSIKISGILTPLLLYALIAYTEIVLLQPKSENSCNMRAIQASEWWNGPDIEGNGTVFEEITFVFFEGCLTVHLYHEIRWNANLMQQCNSLKFP